MSAFWNQIVRLSSDLQKFDKLRERLDEDWEWETGMRMENMRLRVNENGNDMEIQGVGRYDLTT